MCVKEEEQHEIDNWKSCLAIPVEQQVADFGKSGIFQSCGCTDIGMGFSK